MDDYFWYIVGLPFVAILVFFGISSTNHQSTYNDYCKGAGFDLFGGFGAYADNVETIAGIELIRCTRMVMNQNGTVEIERKWVPYKR